MVRRWHYGMTDVHQTYAHVPILGTRSRDPADLTRRNWRQEIPVLLCVGGCLLPKAGDLLLFPKSSSRFPNMKGARLRRVSLC